MALGLTQPLRDISIRNISLGGIGSQCVGLKTSRAACIEIWESQPAGTLRVCPGL